VSSSNDFWFDKKLLFNSKSIKRRKMHGQEKRRAKGRGTEGVFFSIQAGIERPSLGRWGIRIFLEFPPQLFLGGMCLD
jgi:hypothetical protein